MDLAIEDPNFLGRGLAVRPAGWWHGPRLILDGSAVKGRRGRFLVHDNRGQDVSIRLISNHVDPIPKVTVGDRDIRLARPLEWYEYVWSGLPILMALHGGALGAVCGFAALRRSTEVFRGEGTVAKKFVITALISVAAIIAYFVLGVTVVTLIRGAGSWKSVTPP